MGDIKTSGIVIGTRKAGTTWLYENMRKDDRVCVSEKVKESGFFAGMPSLDTTKYDALFEPQAGQVQLEVDTSVCYDGEAPNRIEAYNPDMRIVLVFREPAAFLSSRHTHSLRKGEVSQSDPAEAMEAHEWLRDELDYPAIAARFGRFAERGALKIVKYEDLKSDPHGFYRDVMEGLGVTDGSFVPDTEPVNVSRESSMQFVSAALSKGAIAARKMGLHSLVNGLKSFGLHKKIEHQRDTSQVADSLTTIRAAVETYRPETLAYYNAL